MPSIDVKGNTSIPPSSPVPAEQPLAIGSRSLVMEFVPPSFSITYFTCDYLLLVSATFISTLMPHSENIVSLVPCFIHSASFFLCQYENVFQLNWARWMGVWAELFSHVRSQSLNLEENTGLPSMTCAVLQAGEFLNLVWTTVFYMW